MNQEIISQNKKMNIFTILFSIFLITNSFDPILNEQISKFYENVLGVSLSGRWKQLSGYSEKYGPQEMIFGVPQTDPIYKEDVNTYTFFKSNSGEMQMFFWSKNSNNIPDQLYMQLYEDKFINKKLIEFKIDLRKHQSFSFVTQNKQTKLQLWSGKNIITTVSLYQHFQQLIRFDITIDLDIYLTKQNFKLISTNFADYNFIELTLNSKSINFSAISQKIQYPIEHYILLFFAIFQAGFVVFNKQLSHQNVAQRRKIMYRISQWIILHIFCFICFISSLYISLGLYKFDTKLQNLLIIGLMNIGTGLFFLRNYQMVMSKFKNRYMMLKAFIFIFVYFVLANKFYDDSSFWIFQTFVLLFEQIIYSMIQGGRGGLPLDLVGLIFVSRWPLIYIIMSQSVAFRIQSIMISQFLILILVFSFQLIIIYLQYKYTGTFMIPNELIPGYYDYYRVQSAQSEKMKEECPICLEPYNKEPESKNIQLEERTANNINDDNHQVNLTTQVINGPQGRVRYMQTPCSHNFHITCLVSWMKTQLVCPICKRSLPQLAQLN